VAVLEACDFDKDSVMLIAVAKSQNPSADDDREPFVTGKSSGPLLLYMHPCNSPLSMSKLQRLEDSFGPRRQACRHDKPIHGSASRRARSVAVKTVAVDQSNHPVSIECYLG
jgi:hypothetical protein